MLTYIARNYARASVFFSVSITAVALLAALAFWPSAVSPDVASAQEDGPIITGGGGEVDLVIDSISINPPTPVQDVSTDVTVYFRNNGGAEAGSFWIDFYRESYPAGTGDSVCFVSSLGGESSSSCTMQVTWDTSGTHSAYAEIDSDQNISETNEGNNIYGPHYVTVLSNPDLVIESISVNPPAPFQGITADVTVNFRNDGDTDAGSFWIDFYEAFYPSGTGDAVCFVSFLSAHGSDSCTMQVTWDTGGTNNAHAEIDSDQNVAESDEGNNIFGPQPVTVLWVDLVVDSIELDPPQPFPGMPVDVTVNYSNLGTGDINSIFYVDFYQHLATPPGPFDVGDDYCEVSSLAGSASASCALEITYPAAGMQSAWAQIDTDQGVAESDESNNVFGPQGVTVQDGVDLIIDSIVFDPAQPVIGNPVDVTVNYRNAGNLTSTNFWVDFYDHEVSPPGLAFGDFSCAVPTLAGGATGTCGGQATYNAAVTHTAWAQIDLDQVVVEVNEGNNVFGPQGVNVVNGPDLVVDSMFVHAGGYVPLEGQAASVVVNVRNWGPVASGSFTIDFYADLNSAPAPSQAGDVSCVINSLAPGGTAASCLGSFVYSAPGTYDVWAQVDTYDAVIEQVETNNVSGPMTVTVPADWDGDGDLNAVDNCPAWPNPAQTLPAWALPSNDVDCDGFTRAREEYLRTDWLKHCAPASAGATPLAVLPLGDPGPLPTWPLDMNNSRQINTVDVGFFVGKIGLDKTEVGWTARLDLNQTPTTGLINTVDVGFYVGRLGNVCSPVGP